MCCAADSSHKDIQTKSSRVQYYIFGMQISPLPYYCPLHFYTTHLSPNQSQHHCCVTCPTALLAVMPSWMATRVPRMRWVKVWPYWQTYWQIQAFIIRRCYWSPTAPRAYYWLSMADVSSQKSLCVMLHLQIYC